MNKRLNTKKIKRSLFLNGYVEIKNIFSKKTCNKLISSLEYEKQKLSKNKYFKDEASQRGQIIIRDLLFRNPKVFLKLIDNINIVKILDPSFDEEYILDNFMASSSVKVKKNNYKRIVHIDSHISVNDPSNTLDIVVLICLNDFNKHNGSTIVWPKSHLTGVKIQKNKNINTEKMKSKTLNIKQGSLVFFLGHTWHKIGENLNGKDRWGILLHYKRWWIKPATNFTKCGEKIFKMLNNRQKRILGFSSISPEYNFKKNVRNLKTLRKISKVPKLYKEALVY